MILLDTHVVLWWQAGGARLSKLAAREIARAESIAISPVSLWEIATLLRKGRISLDRDPYQWARDLLEEDLVELTTVSAPVGIGAGLLETSRFPGDPADRILYATAREMVAPMITKDRAIRKYAAAARDVRVIW